MPRGGGASREEGGFVCLEEQEIFFHDSISHYDSFSGGYSAGFQNFDFPF